jgi:hypothetical protein
VKHAGLVQSVSHRKVTCSHYDIAENCPLETKAFPQYSVNWVEKFQKLHIWSLNMKIDSWKIIFVQPKNLETTKF